MAHHPIPDPEAAEPVSPGGNQLTGTGRRTGAIASSGLAADLADLAAKFSSEKGGNLPAQLSADLALEVVLNEIAEQACHLTRASGAAVILERNGEWVCRASSGAGAPELGARLERDSGLTAECINTGQAQRCSDTETDATVDVQACRSLGVRSIIMVPIVHAEKLIGVFAAFSPRISAFREEDEQNLNLLSSYVTSSLALAFAALPSTDSSARKMPILAEGALEEVRTETADLRAPNWNGTQSENGIDRAFTAAMDPCAQFEPQERSLPADRHRAVKIATWTLTAVVVAFAGFLTLVAGQRWLGNASGVRSAARSITGDPPGGANSIKDTRVAEAAKTGSPVGVPPGAAAAARSNAQALNPQSKEGGLVVYENGKEVFRMAPATGGSERSGNDGSNLPAPAVGEAGIYELPPGAAEGSLLYRVEPDYPEAAREHEIQGAVVLDVWARPDGSVRSVNLLSGDQSLSEAAIAAVKQWKFRPHLVEGKPVEMRTQVTLNFKLPST
jgi:TonB family protein